MQAIQFLKEEFPLLLQQIQPDMQPVWGIMSPQHMVEHLSGTIIISDGRFPMEAMYDAEKLNKNYQFILGGQRRLKRNTKAPVLPPEPLPLRFADLEEAKTKLLSSLDKFFAHYEANPDDKQMHPAFGMLNFEDWAYFHAIHCQYHLDQFGLFEGGAAI